MLTKETFEMQVKSLAGYIAGRSGIDVALSVLDKNLYYDNLKYLDDVAFCKTTSRLIGTWTYRHFPMIGDIKKAALEFYSPLKEYKPEPRIENVDAITKQKQWRTITEGIKLLSEISDIVVKKKVGARFHSMGECEKKDVWVPFCKQILAAGMLWDKQAKRFVDRVEPIPEHCFDLRGMYPPEH